MSCVSCVPGAGLVQGRAAVVDDVAIAARRCGWHLGEKATLADYGAGMDRVAERRRAVALAQHYREAEQLSIAQIAGRLGRSPATVKAYLYDPTGEKARAVKARYQRVCRTCGA